ncbi:MAG TPA: leucyl aminopeptidase [Actinomycetes bacterium]
MSALTTIELSSARVADIAADATVVGVAKGPDGPVATPEARAVLGDALTDGLRDLGVTGNAGDATRIPTPGGLTPQAVAVGLGEETAGGEYDHHESLRRATGAGIRALAGINRVAVVLPASTVPALAAVAEGALFGAYAFTRYRSRLDGQKPPVSAIIVATPLADDDAARTAVARAEVLAAATHFSRDLINTPPSDLYPSAFADAAVTAAKEHGIAVEVLDEIALKEAGYGGIIGVGQGSVHPPRLVRLSYSHPEAIKTLVLVGKGITFDSGGLSIKAAQGMEWMKSDMSGAAVVVATVIAAARLRIPLNLIAYAALAENMPSGTAQRPSDVLKIYGGKTVEVLNTDAEGRLVLADALARSGADEPDVLVDVATLTGSQLIALGARVGAIMSNDDALRAHIHNAANRAGEQLWPMPLPDELRKSLDSDIADIANMGERYGGMLVAGLFLRDFVPAGVRWAHLDIAGPAFNQGEAYGYTSKGGTGVPLRTLLTLAEDLAAGRFA